MNELMMKNRNLLFSKGKQFQQTFHTPMNRFFDPITGFDIVKFDEWLGTPDGKSTAEFLTEKFGEEASEFVRSLI